MRRVSASEVEDELEFAKAAATAFAKQPAMMSYSRAEMIPGCLLALRWGMGDDCVVVVKLSDDHVPTNYQQLVREIVQ